MSGPHDITAGDVLIGFCTVPDRPAALRIAEALVEERLAACVNIVPGIRSVYRWEGKVEASDELLLIIKTTRQAPMSRIRERILTLHPYDVPEFLLVPVGSGLDKYVAWVGQSVAPAEG